MNDQELLHHFERCTLPQSEWTHRAHVRIAFLYLSAHPFERALCKVREGIQALNAAHGTPETPTRGYNETTTVAFLRILAATLAAYAEACPAANSEAFCGAHPHLLSKTILRLYYSPLQRMRPEGKHQFIEPDLAPLPEIPVRSAPLPAALPFEIEIRTDPSGVDWTLLKSRLAEDDFDNGRTPEELEISFSHSAVVVFAWSGGEVIGKARALSDGVCNAYVVDVWTYSPYRRRGVARAMLKTLLDRLEGQHVYLFTDSAAALYEQAGFHRQGIGMSQVAGGWLRRP